MSIFEWIIRGRVLSFVGRAFRGASSDKLIDAHVNRSPQRQIGIVITDISKYVNLCERLDSKELLNVMNVYWDAIGIEINENRGILDKYFGDKSIILFEGDFDSIAGRMQKFAESIICNKRFLDLGLDVYIGMSIGMCFVGNVGHPWRKCYTAIGEPVNKAYDALSAAKTTKNKIALAINKEKVDKYDKKIGQIGSWNIFAK